MQAELAVGMKKETEVKAEAFWKAAAERNGGINRVKWRQDQE